MISKVFLLGLLLAIVLCTSLSGVAAQDGFDEDLSTAPADDYQDGDMGSDYGYGGEEELEGTGQPEAAKQLNSWDEIEKFVKENEFDTSVIGFFDASSHPEDLETFKEVAMTDGYVYKFAYTVSKEVLEAKKYDGCAVLVFPPPKYVNEKMERSKYRLPMKTIANKQQAILNFAKSKSLPLTGEYTSKSRESYDSLQKPVVSVFSSIDHERNSKGYNYLANRVRKVAKKYEGTIVFVLVDSDNFSEAMERDYGFEDPSAKEIYAGIRDGDMFFTMEAKFSVENLTSFVENFKAGQLQGKQKIKSEEHDHGDDDGDIKPVVAVGNDNAQSVLENPDADILVEFYAPWCGHCRALKPEYKKVAEHFVNDDSVTIAAFDATAGTVPPQFDVQGYPTLYFVPKNKKLSPIPYEGGRSAAEMIEFVEAYRTRGSDEL